MWSLKGGVCRVEGGVSGVRCEVWRVEGGVPGVRCGGWRAECRV